MLQNKTKITIILPTFNFQPKQGVLEFNSSDQEWYFKPGQKGNTPPIPLPNFFELAPSMIQNKKLFKGWKSRQLVLSAQQVRAISNVLANLFIAQKVIASMLKNAAAPTSLTPHKLMDQDDKKT